ncbi:hypothetical protein D3C84_975700 [compost metagenome]
MLGESRIDVGEHHAKLQTLTRYKVRAVESHLVIRNLDYTAWHTVVRVTVDVEEPEIEVITRRWSVPGRECVQTHTISIVCSDSLDSKRLGDEPVFSDAVFKTVLVFTHAVAQGHFVRVCLDGG